jgi:predicted O-methyltransferase YrrM
MKVLRRTLEIAASPFVALTAPVYYAIARTGIGVEQCRRHGFQPMMFDYYQPIPDYETVPDTWFRSARSLPGFTIDTAKVDHTLERMRPFAHECNWPAHGDATGYHWDNPSFGFSSAAVLHSMLRGFGARKLIEIGSGYSSVVAHGALQLNDPNSELICIEPYPTDRVRRLAAANARSVRLVEQKAQDTPLETFLDLGAGDVLFIDSSHVSKLHSDVNFLYLEVLPRLRPGVVVHIHDIYIPYEYPRDHFVGAQKIFWNEQYILQALLTNNAAFEILLPLFAIQRDSPERLRAVFPQYDPQQHRASSSFWLRTV